MTVPGYYYKLFYSPSKQQMIAYVLPNEESKRSLNSFAVPVSKVEKMTGIDFFPQLPDDLEKLLEADTLSHLKHMPKQPGKSYPPTRKEQIIAVAGAVILFLLVYFLMAYFFFNKLSITLVSSSNSFGSYKRVRKTIFPSLSMIILRVTPAP